MKLLKLFTLFLLVNFTTKLCLAQANPTIAVLPSNSGLVNLGAVLDLEITIGNTGSNNIAAFKLRPVITVPSIVNILSDAQQTELPVGWSIVSNSGSQIRICNGTDVIAGNSFRTIIIKVQGATIGGPLTFSGQLNFGGVNCSLTGPSPSGNNISDDFATSTIQVVAGCSLAVTATSGNILCNAGTTTITATSSGISGVVEYALTGNITTPFQTSNIFTVPAGSYNVTARDASNPLTCVAISSSILINEPSAISTPSVSIVQPSCAVSVGIVSLTSSLTGLTFSVDGNSYSNYTNAISLATGTHTIRAKNNNNCLSPITSFTINAQPITPSIPSIGLITQPDCINSTGSVVINGLPSGNWIINPSAITGNSANTSIVNLTPGNYNFTVTNSDGCTSLATASVNINTVVGAPALPLATIIQPTCTISTGSITITSPTTGLTYSLDGASYITYPATGFAGLTTGNHNLIAKNISGCLSPIASFIINTQPTSPPAAVVSIIQPTCNISTGNINITSPTIGLTFSFDGGAFNAYPAGGYVTTTGTHTIATQNTSGCIASVTNNILVNLQPATPTVSASASVINCFGTNSSITAIGSVGVLPYSYSLNTATFQSSNVFSVGAGSFIISIKDSNGCVGNSNNILVTQPTPITATYNAGAIACSGGYTTLVISATGGVGSYEYKINNKPFQTSNSFIVNAGTYNVTVRLLNNPACSSEVVVPINIQQPDSLKTTTNALAINKCGGTTQVNVSATGGKLPYSGTGNFTKGPGKWKFSVTDANGCVAACEITILPPGCVDVKVFPNPAQNIITINHSEAAADAAIRIYSPSGALVISKKVTQNNFITTIDVSKLSGAVYTLVYLNASDKKEIKFLKINSK